MQRRKLTRWNREFVCEPTSFYLERGMLEGHDLEDWMQAEQKIQQCLTTSQTMAKAA